MVRIAVMAQMALIALNELIKVIALCQYLSMALNENNYTFGLFLKMNQDGDSCPLLIGGPCIAEDDEFTERLEYSII